MNGDTKLGDVVTGRQGVLTESRWAYVTQTRSTKVALLLGYLSLIVAIFVAHDAAAMEYEVSIYTGTPLAFWVLTGAALLVATTAAVYRFGTLAGRLGLVLAGTSVLSILSLPLIRGYYYYGLTDGMNHLGFTRKLAVGIRSFFEFIYPGGHSTAIFFDAVTGIGIPRALMFVVFVCLLSFVVFVPLAVRELVPDSRVVVLAVFAGLLITPINNVSTTLQFHSFTLATLLSPLFFYLLFKHLGHGAEDRWLTSRLSAVSLVLPLVGITVMLYHPQTMLNVVVIVVVIAAIQVFYSWRGADNAIGRARPVYGLALLLLVAFYLWTSKHWQTSATIERTISAVESYFQGTAEPASNLESRQQSASEIGVSTSELFVKLILVEVVLSLVAAALVLANVFGRVQLREEAKAAVSFLTIGGLVLTPYFLTQVLGDIAHNFFRHLGFVMVLVSILAPIALGMLWHRYGSRQAIRPLLVVVITVSLVLSMVAVFPSPFIYLYNHQASDQHMTGWETTFENQPSNEPKPMFIGTIRLVPSRYENALAAKPGTSWYPGLVKPFPRGSVSPTDTELRDLTGFYASHPEQIVHRDHYLVVSAVDRKRALDAYDELRYTADCFASIGGQDDVHLVHANGEFNSYYVDLPTPPGTLYNVTDGGTGPDPSANRSLAE